MSDHLWLLTLLRDRSKLYFPMRALQNIGAIHLRNYLYQREPQVVAELMRLLRM